MARSHPGGRRTQQTRQAKQTVLIVTNGQLTEQTYLKEAKRRAKRPNVTIKVDFVPGEPDSLLKKLQSPFGDTSGYDEVWIVVDEDGLDRTAFISKCARLCGKQQKWFAVVSRPCFEVWLIAHYTKVRNYAAQGDAQKHFRSLVPSTLPDKQLPRDFPYDQVGQAIERCHLPNDSLNPLDRLPTLPGTAMPHLIEALQII